jgi:hypothetical protein
MGKSVWTWGLLALACVVSVAQADLIVTFEEGRGLDGTIINDQYEGVTFQAAGSGEPWRYGDAEADHYNVSSWPTGQQWGSGEYWMNDYVFGWTDVAGNDGQISIDAADATYMQINYASRSDFYLEAYNSAGQLIASDSGPANLRYENGNPNGPGTLLVTAPAGETIAYARVHDSGNYWCIDNVITDGSGISGPGDLQIAKFFDENENGLYDAGEILMGGWDFLVEGDDYSRIVTTNPSGQFTLDNLDPGLYTITEFVQAGWVPTTENPMTIEVIEGETVTAWFGNVPEPSTLMLLLVAIPLVRRR